MTARTVSRRGSTRWAVMSARSSTALTRGRSGAADGVHPLQDAATARATPRQATLPARIRGIVFTTWSPGSSYVQSAPRAPFVRTFGAESSGLSVQKARAPTLGGVTSTLEPTSALPALKLG